MKPEASLDMRQFQRDLNALAERTSRTLPEFLNARAYFLARKAMDFTDKAERSKIEALGLKTKEISAKGRRKFIFKKENAIAYYLAMRGKKDGKNPGWIGRQFKSRADLARAARRFIAGKLRAIGFMKSGWLAPLRLFSRYAGSKGIRVEGYSERGAKKSRAIAAKRGPRPEATLINNVTPLDYVTGAVRTVARSMQERALNRAFASEHAEMKDHLKKKLSEEYKKLGATVR